MVKYVPADKASIMLFQCIPVDDTQGCDINHTDAITSVDSIVIKFTTTGKECAFEVTETNSNNNPKVTDCEKIPGSDSEYQCKLQSLEPGTAYHLRVESKTDGTQANVSVFTSKWHITFITPHDIQYSVHTMFCVIMTDLVYKSIYRYTS